MFLPRPSRRQHTRTRTGALVETLEGRRLMAFDFLVVPTAIVAETAAEKATAVDTFTVNRQLPAADADLEPQVRSVHHGGMPIPYFDLEENGIQLMPAGEKTYGSDTIDLNTVNDRFHRLITDAAKILAPLRANGYQPTAHIGVASDLPDANGDVTLGQFAANGQFTILLNESALNDKSDAEIVEVILHEMGHLFAHVEYDANAEAVIDYHENAEDNPMFQAFVNDVHGSGSKTSSYGETDAHEDFAESFMEYMSDPDSMRTTNPARWTFFEYHANGRVHTVERHPVVADSK